MDSLFPVLIGVAVTVGLIALILIFSAPKNSTEKKNKSKNRQTIIREATKKLSQDSRSPDGLLPLSDLYYQEHSWEKAFPLYKTLLDIAPAHPSVNIAQVSLRLGICAVKLEKIPEALRALALAREGDPHGFEVNYYLGQAFFFNKDYDKAVSFFKKALAINREFTEAYEFLALSLYKNHLYREALPYLKRALDVNPENTELLFAMADSMNACGNSDRALKIFLHLRPDPKYGAESCLSAGMIHSSRGLIEKTIQDYEIGLRHKDAPLKILTQIRYNLAQTYLRTNEMGRAVSLLHEIQVSAPGYKDVPLLVGRYEELNKNSLLKNYLVAGNSDFITLCRKLVAVFYSKAHVKIVAIEAKPDIAEIQTEIETVKWEDSVVFLFYRNTGSTGELFMRDFYGRIRDLKAGRGICITAGTYTEEARKFVEGRPIDLVDKSDLLKIFAKLAATKHF